MTGAQLVLLLKFYNLEDNIDSVPNMRKFFGRYLERQGMGIFGRNYGNLMKEETRKAIVKGMASEEIKKQIVKNQLLRDKAQLLIWTPWSFERI
jgi:hypothetical protein